MSGAELAQPLRSRQVDALMPLAVSIFDDKCTCCRWPSRSCRRWPRSAGTSTPAASRLSQHRRERGGSELGVGADVDRERGSLDPLESGTARGAAFASTIVAARSYEMSSLLATMAAASLRAGSVLAVGSAPAPTGAGTKTAVRIPMVEERPSFTSLDQRPPPRRRATPLCEGESSVGRSIPGMNDASFEREAVDGLPVILVRPPASIDRHRLALFLPYLGGPKEAVAPHLVRLADRGFTALSFDPFRLGERGDGDDRAVATSVFDHFRRDMWPILGQTTLDAVHVLDWATAQLPVESGNVVAGGLSMGGDISVALAGIDHRVTRVAAVVATPDWTRPGMTRVGESDNVIEQGQPRAYGQWLYAHLDPATHPRNYAHGPAIAFELGAEDTHVPPEAATRFRELLRTSAPLAAERMRITEHAGLDHLGAAREERVIRAALDWLALDPPGTP